MRLFRHLLTALPAASPLREKIGDATLAADCEDSTPLLFLQAQLARTLGRECAELEELLDRPELASNVFLDNLKTATHWVLKAVGVEYLLDQVEHGNRQNVLHIATHLSNLIKVSENVVVRRMAGASLLSIAPVLTPDRRNEIAVELSKALETGQSELSKYIPEYLGRFSLWLTPRELDEVVDQMQFLLSSASANVVAAALSTVGSILEYYAVYGGRFGEDPETLDARRRRLAGLLLKGLSSFREPVRQEALHILGDGLFASRALTYEEKVSLFTLTAKKVLCLIGESGEKDLTFFYTAAALSHIYRFIIYHSVEDGPFRFTVPDKVAFFPGTFDPFSLSHKGIVQNIRDLGFEVYLAVDEFSWSKKAQPGLIRRQLVSMNARAADLARRERRFSAFLDEGRSFGPHGEGLVIANSIEHYDDALSRELTAEVLSANRRIRELGFKPFVAPALSSGAFQLLLMLRGQWHCGSVCLGGVWLGCRSRLTPAGLETEALALPEELFARLRQAEATLAAIE